MPAVLFNANVLAGVNLYCSEDYCLLQSQAPWQALSSAPLNGGFFQCQNFLNLKVNGEPVDEAPAQSLQNFLCRLGVQTPSTAMMTAASMKSMRVVTKKYAGLGFTAIVTTGLDNARCAGDKADEKPQAGTINMQVLSHQTLSQSAMVEAIAMITEAKASALLKHQVRSKVSNNIATGTGTDCTLIACPLEDKPIDYVGKHTLAGELLARACIDALSESLEWYQLTV